MRFDVVVSAEAVQAMRQRALAAGLARAWQSLTGDPSAGSASCEAACRRRPCSGHTDVMSLIAPGPEFGTLGHEPSRPHGLHSDRKRALVVDSPHTASASSDSPVST